ERTNEVAFLHRPYPPRRVTLERVIPVFWHRWRTKKGAVSRALGDSIQRGLRADSGDDVGAGAFLVPCPAADGARDAVGDRVGRRDRELGRDDGRVVGLQDRKSTRLNSSH